MSCGVVGYSGLPVLGSVLPEVVGADSVPELSGAGAGALDPEVGDSLGDPAVGDWLGVVTADPPVVGADVDAVAQPAGAPRSRCRRPAHRTRW